MDEGKNLLDENYLEDGFDLNRFKEEHNQQRDISAEKRDSKTVMVLLTFIIALGILILVQAAILGRHYLESRRSESISREAFAVFYDASLSTDGVDGTGTTSEVSQDDEKTVKPPVSKLREYFNNDEIVGYLIIDDTNIFNAVAQTNNNEFYQSMDLYKKKSSLGAVFLDYGNNHELTDYNTIIYGKNTIGGSMFGDLGKFTDPNYLNDHMYVKYITPYEITKWRIFSAYGTDSDEALSESVNSDKDSFLNIMKQMKDRSAVATDEVLEKGGQVLTLSTYEPGGGARYVVHAVLIEREFLK